MRLVGRVLTLAGIVLVAAACDTNQPTGIEGGTAVLEYRVESTRDPAPGVQNVFEAIVYPDLRVDSNGDMVADDVIPARNEFNAPPVCILGDSTTALVPWGIGFEISVVRAGTTVPVVIDTTQSGTGNFAFSRVTKYDETGTPRPDQPITPPVPVSGGRTALAYTNGTDTHTGSAVYQRNCASVSEIPPYENTTFTVGRGDLIQVSARRDAAGLVGRPARFTIELLVNGAPVEVRGTSTVDEPRSDVTFTYLVN
jgi:hypothetical protein